jgi:hypothetical protein
VWTALLALALGGAGYAYWKEREGSRRPARIAALEAARDRLRARLALLAKGDPVVATAPQGGVLIGIPDPFASRLVGQVATGFLSQVEIELRDLRVRKAGKVRVKTLLGRMTPGHYALDLRIETLQGLLAAGAPTLRIADAGVGVALPVSITRGEGRARLRFRWDSRGIAGAVCGDFSASVAVSGRVVPHTYPVAGQFALELRGASLVATPRFPDLVIRLKVEPSAESWAEVERIIEARGLRCRTALKLVDLRGTLERLLDKGFNVRVPQRILKPMRFPAALRQSVVLDGRGYDLAIAPRGLEVTPGLLWYAADVTATGAAVPH